MAYQSHTYHLNSTDIPSVHRMSTEDGYTSRWLDLTGDKNAPLRMYLPGDLEDAKNYLDHLTTCISEMHKLIENAQKVTR